MASSGQRGASGNLCDSKTVYRSFRMSKGPIQKQTIERDERNKTRVEGTSVLCRVPEEQLISVNLEKLFRAEFKWTFQRERNFPRFSPSVPGGKRDRTHIRSSGCYHVLSIETLNRFIAHF